MRRRYFLVRVRGNSKLPHCPLANERDVVQGIDVSDNPLTRAGWRWDAIMDLLSIIEHEVDNACVQEDSAWYVLKIHRCDVQEGFWRK